MKSTPTPISTLILDDEQDAIDVLQFIIGRYCPQLQVIATASSADEARKKIESLRPSLLILDINIGSTSQGRNSFDLLRDLPEYPCEIVFVTAYDQYAIRAIKLHAFDYLLKPVTAQELMEMAQRLAVRIMESPQNRLNSLSDAPTEPREIWLPVHNRLRRVRLEDIHWVKAEEHFSRIALADGEMLFAGKSFKDLRDLLEEPAFFCIHRSYLIQLAAIEEMLPKGENQVLMPDGTRLPIARNRKKAFFALMAQGPTSTIRDRTGSGGETP